MEYKDIKKGDVIEYGNSAGEKGIVFSKYKGQLIVIESDGKDYSIHPNAVSRVIKNVKIKSILEAIIN